MKKINIMTIHLLLLISTMIIHFIFNFSRSNGFSNEDITTQSRIFLVIVLILIFLWIRYIGRVVSAHFIIFVVMILFFSGQVILYSFGITYTSFNVFNLYSNNQLSSAIWFTLYFLFLYQIGTIITYKKENINKLDKAIVGNSTTVSVKIVGWGMFITSGPLYMAEIIRKLITSIQYGYLEIYNNDSVVNSGILSSMNMFFIPSLFILLSIYKDSKFMKKLLIIVIMSIILINLTIGLRGAALILFLSSIFLYFNNAKKISKKVILIITITTLLLLFFVPVISQFRNESEKGLSSLLEIMKLAIEENFIVKIMGELGGTMRVLLDVMSIKQNGLSTFDGNSYFDSITSFIPSFFMFGHERIGLADWLQNVLNLNYGPGFTLVGESYLNFGLVGLIVPIILGMILGWIFSIQFSVQYNFLLGAFYASTLYFVLFTIRNQILLFVRFEIYACIVPLIMIVILSHVLKKSTKSQMRL